MQHLITAIGHGVPAVLSEVITLGRMLTKRAADVLAYRLVRRGRWLDPRWGTTPRQPLRPAYELVEAGQDQNVAAEVDLLAGQSLAGGSRSRCGPSEARRVSPFQALEIRHTRHGLLAVRSAPRRAVAAGRNAGLPSLGAAPDSQNATDVPPLRVGLDRSDLPKRPGPARTGMTALAAGNLPDPAPTCRDKEIRFAQGYPGTTP